MGERYPEHEANRSNGYGSGYERQELGRGGEQPKRSGQDDPNRRSHRRQEEYSRGNYSAYGSDREGYGSERQDDRSPASDPRTGLRGRHYPNEGYGYGSSHRDPGRGYEDQGRQERERYGQSQGFGPYASGEALSGEDYSRQYRGGGEREYHEQYGRYESASGHQEGGFTPSAYRGPELGARPKPRRGEHYGRGPKGFTFSDEEIQRAVCRELYRHGGIDASEISVEVKHGEVSLSGTVDSRRTKHLIEEFIEDEIPGVIEFHNQLRVRREGSGASMLENNSTERTGSKQQKS